MVVELLTIHFHLAGCRSLKEKRQRISGLKGRYGRNPNLAVSELAEHDNHRQSKWCIVAVASDRGITSALLEEVLNWAARAVDATIVDAKRETLSMPLSNDSSSRYLG